MDTDSIQRPIFGISRHRMGIDGNGITTLVDFMGCPQKCPRMKIESIIHQNIGFSKLQMERVKMKKAT